MLKQFRVVTNKIYQEAFLKAAFINHSTIAAMTESFYRVQFP